MHLWVGHDCSVLWNSSVLALPFNIVSVVVLLTSVLLVM